MASGTADPQATAAAQDGVEIALKPAVAELSGGCRGLNK
jgi:hypothetical protein